MSKGNPEDLMKAEDLWIKEAQRNIQEELKAGKYKRLCPRLRKDGIYVVGGRATSWIEMSYNISNYPMSIASHVSTQNMSITGDITEYL